MTTHQPTLAVEHVTRRFGQTLALDDVSLTVGAGEIVCLVGHSGCGKSTLLRVIAGIERIDSGRLVIDGQVVNDGDVFVEPEHRQVGLMFQDYALFPHLTARQNIGFGLMRLRRDEAERRIDTIIETLGIGALADKYPHMLSGGEQQRIALARALAPEPAVLLMDEPFSNLDYGMRDFIRRQTLGLIRRLGMTALIVTHDPEEALAIGDRVVLMNNGKVVETGSGEAVYRFPRTPYAASFFSRVNTVPARRVGDWLESPVGRFPARPEHGAAVRLFIQPRALAPAETGVPALVRSHAMLGEMEEWSLVFDGLDEPLVMRTSVRHDIAVGSRINVAIDPHDVMVFPEEPGNDPGSPISSIT